MVRKSQGVRTAKDKAKLAIIVSDSTGEVEAGKKSLRMPRVQHLEAPTRRRSLFTKMYPHYLHLYQKPLIDWLTYARNQISLPQDLATSCSTRSYFGLASHGHLLSRALPVIITTMTLPGDLLLLPHTCKLSSRLISTSTHCLYRTTAAVDSTLSTQKRLSRHPSCLHREKCWNLGTSDRDKATRWTHQPRLCLMHNHHIQVR